MQQGFFFLSHAACPQWGASGKFNGITQEPKMVPLRRGCLSTSLRLSAVREVQTDTQWFLKVSKLSVKASHAARRNLKRECSGRRRDWEI